ncbi:MAG: DNA-formamidopyrimidine glycosylase family protein [Myxococcota bacterium]
MPELPEAEIARRIVEVALRGARLEAVAHVDPRMLRRMPEPERFEGALVGRRLLGMRRHGKHLVGALEGGGSWWIHLGMSGKLVADESMDAMHRHARLVVRAGATRLSLIDPRRFGATAAGPRAELRRWAGLDELGPDALALIEDAAGFRAAFHGGARLKAALLDQRRLAGVGNIQAAEACFRAGLDPARPLSALSDDERDALREGLRASFAHTLAATLPGEDDGHVAYLSDGAHVANPFLVYGREGEPCTRCTTPIARRREGGRSTFHCPGCQR